MIKGYKNLSDISCINLSLRKDTKWNGKHLYSWPQLPNGCQPLHVHPLFLCKLYMYVFCFYLQNRSRFAVSSILLWNKERWIYRMGICLQQIQTGNRSLREDQAFVRIILFGNTVDFKQVKLQHYYKVL